MKNTHNIEYYKKLPWTKVFIQNEDGSYFAKIQELKGCMTEGNDIQDAHNMLEDALICWLEIALEKDIEIPAPASLEKYSGKLLLRMSKSLHKALVEKSEKENISLNSIVNMILTKSLAS